LFRFAAGDDEVAQRMWHHLSTNPSPSEWISFASLLAKSRGLNSELEAWCRSKLEQTQRESVGVFAMDLWLGQTTTVRSRLVDLLRARF
jgi:pantoate kinase